MVYTMGAIVGGLALHCNGESTMTKKHTFSIEVTDTFGGEANYCWVSRYTIKASSFRGAMQALSRQHGGHWRKVADYGDQARYDHQGACVCAFVEYAIEA